MDIKIKHLGYTVRVRPRKAHTTSPNWMLYVTERTDENTATIYANSPIKTSDIPSIVHEIIHALQFLSADRDIQFTQEQEHFAYLAQHILNEILDYKYIFTKRN